MPPRFAYWTIIVDGQPTSFRSSAADDLLPTFNRLKAKNPSAVMMWFQSGKLWPSRLDAQEAMRARGDIGRSRDPKQGGFSRNVEGEGFSPRHDSLSRRSGEAAKADKPEWKPKGSFKPEPRDREKPQWKPKSPNAREVARRDWKPKPYTPASAKASAGQAREGFKPEASSRSEKPEWKPKGSFKREFKSKTDARPEWRAQSFNPKASKRSVKPNWKPESRRSGEAAKADQSRGRFEKPEWKPKGEFKAETAKADDKPEFRDRKKWRPGGDHQDPRQKYKDAKKAKWTRFKKTIRARSSRPPKKRDH